MQNLLTASLELVTVSFALIVFFDFVGGLVHLYCTNTSNLAVKIELEQVIAAQIEPDSQPQVVPGWDLIEPAGPETATLSWIEQNMPPTEIYAVEMPDAIALCKARQPQVQPVVTLASQQQLISAGIRKCKKLASYHQIRRYNKMRLAELASVLEGMVTATELVA